MYKNRLLIIYFFNAIILLNWKDDFMNHNISIDSNLKKSLVINSIIFILVLLGTIFMYIGYQFMTNTTLLDNAGLASFKFYILKNQRRYMIRILLS